MQVQAAAAQAAYYIQSTRQSSTPVEQTRQQQSAPKTDTVEISADGKGKLMQSLLEGMFPDSPSGSFNEQLQADVTWMNDKLNSMLGEDAGNYKFTIGADGHVNVTGGEKAAEIEQAFEDDFEMHNRLARISANTSFIRAANEHMEFSKAYEQDPEAAVAQYSYLFNGGNRADVSFEYGQDGLKVVMENIRTGREYLEDYLIEHGNAK